MFELYNKTASELFFHADLKKEIFLFFILLTFFFFFCSPSKREPKCCSEEAYFALRIDRLFSKIFSNACNIFWYHGGIATWSNKIITGEKNQKIKIRVDKVTVFF